MRNLINLQFAQYVGLYVSLTEDRQGPGGLETLALLPKRSSFRQERLGRGRAISQPWSLINTGCRFRKTENAILYNAD